MAEHNQGERAPMETGQQPVKKRSRRAFLFGAGASLSGAILAACGAAPAANTATSAPEAPAAGGATPAATTTSAAGDEQVELLFTNWEGDAKIFDSAVSSFHTKYPNINVKIESTPEANDAYQQKMVTRAASGNLPDVGYLKEYIAVEWAEQGKVMDLTEYFNNPDTPKVLQQAVYRYGNNKIAATNTAGEIVLLYYNKQVFDKYNIPTPPTKAEKALTWPEFVALAKTLTRDTSGRSADDPAFDANNIDVYGLAFNQGWVGWLPLIHSNGGRFASDDGNKLLLNAPEAVEVLQQLQDLIYVHHVSPSPAQSQSMPSLDAMLQTGKIAMQIDGHWRTFINHAGGIDAGIAVLPKFKEAQTILLGGASVVFASTKHPKEALEWYAWHNNPKHVDLFRKGLWMPLQQDYYTNETLIKEWLEGEPGVYGPEARDSVVKYALNNTPLQPPPYWLRNFDKILNEGVEPSLGLLWSNELKAQEAADQAVQKSAALMKGRTFEA